MVFSDPFAAGRGTSDSANIIYVPFVRETEHFINATLIVKLTEADTVFRILCDWQYREFCFENGRRDQWNARNIFHIFAKLDYSVFGRQQFQGIDERLLSDDDREMPDTARVQFDSVMVIYTIRTSAQGTGRNNVLIPVESCEYFSTCVATGPCTEAMLYTRPLTIPQCCLLWMGFEICTTIWIDDGGGGGSGEPGGGGGGSGGGWEPPPCGGGSGRYLVINPCGPGWIPPVLDEPPGYNANAGAALFNNFYVSGSDQIKINTWKNNNIDTSGLDSCRADLLRRLINVLPTSPLGAFLSKLDKAVGLPASPDKFIIHFKTRPLPNNDALTENTSYDASTNEYEADIVLDSATSKDATELFIAAQFIHEVVHAYMAYIWRKFNQGASISQIDSLNHGIVFNAYVDTLRKRDSLNPNMLQWFTESFHHNYMADQLLEYMADILKLFDNNPGTSDRYYWFLAWSGLTRKSIKTWNYHWPNFQHGHHQFPLLLRIA